MNEPMHLVPRADILLIMQVLQDSGATCDVVELLELYNRLEEITNNPPSNVAVKLIT